jgi:hypothetical protein
VVLYKQRKTKTGFQSLSPKRREVWRGVKSHAKKRKIRIYVFFFLRMKPPCPSLVGKGVRLIVRAFLHDLNCQVTAKVKKLALHVGRTVLI